MFEIMPSTDGSRVAIRLVGSLSEDDGLDLRSHLTGLLTDHSSLRILFVTEEWTGWEGWRALWEDVKADLRLNEEVERLAMVGSGTVDRLMTEAMKPFAHATVRWFPSGELDEAWEWLVG
ncbi:MAG: STAS/SEC14 domain-containing protein [Gemmatimonadetes bacterium]|nr:STAS/SEC14 domain-containing protein [Gemmatimonadota bacterium]